MARDSFRRLDKWYGDRVRRHYTPSLAGELYTMLVERGEDAKTASQELYVPAMARSLGRHFSELHAMAAAKRYASGVPTNTRTILVAAADGLEALASMSAATGAEDAFRSAFYDVPGYNDWCSETLSALRVACAPGEAELAGRLARMETYLPRLNEAVLAGAGISPVPIALPPALVARFA